MSEETLAVVILIAYCPESVSTEYPEIAKTGYKSFKELKAMLESGALTNLTQAAYLAHVGRVMKDRATGILVSSGIDRNTAQKLVFYHTETPQDALNLAFKYKWRGVKIVVQKMVVR